MKNFSRRKLSEEKVHGNLLSRIELGGSSGISICYKDIHLFSFGRKDT